MHRPIRPILASVTPWTSVLALLLVLGSGAAPAFASEPAAEPASELATETPTETRTETPAETPAVPGALTFEELVDRELPFGADHPFVGPDDRFRLLLPFPPTGEVTVQGEDDEQVMFSMDLGTGSPVTCFVQLSALDPATSVASVSAASLPLDTEDSPIQAREIHRVDLFPVGHEIVAAADWVYQFEQGGQPVLGLLKVRAASLGYGGILCLHDEVGFSETLDRIMDRLVRTVTYLEDDGDTPFFHEIVALRLDGQPISLSRYTVGIDPDGDYRVESLESNLTPIDAASLSGSESYTIDFGRATGEMISSTHIQSSSAEPETELRLTRGGDGAWSVSGRFQSKELEHTIEHGELMTELLERRRIADFVRSAAPGDRLSVETWAPDLDPTTITSVSMEYLGRRDERYTVEMVLGEIRMVAEFDASGSIVRGDAEMAGIRMDFERVYQSGVFPTVQELAGAPETGSSSE